MEKSTPSSFESIIGAGFEFLGFCSYLLMIHSLTTSNLFRERAAFFEKALSRGPGST